MQALDIRHSEMTEPEEKRLVASLLDSSHLVLLGSDFGPKTGVVPKNAHLLRNVRNDFASSQCFRTFLTSLPWSSSALHLAISFQGAFVPNASVRLNIDGLPTPSARLPRQGEAPVSPNMRGHELF